MGAIRERKKAITRLAMVETLIDESLGMGFDGTPVEHVTNLVGVSRRTFFRYFGSKEEAVFHHERERLAFFRRALTDPGAEGADLPPEERVRLALLQVAGDYMVDLHLLLKRRTVVQGSRVLQAYDQGLDQEWEELTAAVLGGSFQAKLRAGAVIGTARALIRHWLAADGVDDLVALGVYALDQLGFGAGGEA